MQTETVSNECPGKPAAVPAPMDPSAMESVFKKDLKLPTLPTIAMEILKTVQDESCCLAKIGDIISADPSLSAEILKIANSAYFNLPTKIVSVNHAVSILGQTTVKNLALSFTLVRNLRPKTKNGFDYAVFWKNSLICAIAAKLLAKKLSAGNTEDIFTLGILHDIGRLALNQHDPEKYSRVLCATNGQNGSYHQTEKSIFGFDHMAVGAYLTRCWGLPDTFYRPISSHHAPAQLAYDEPAMLLRAQVIYLATLFTDFFTFQKTDPYIFLITEYAGKIKNVEGFEPFDLADEIYQQARILFPLFEIESNEQLDYQEMIEAARDELIKLTTNYMSAIHDQKRKIVDLEGRVTRDGMTDLTNHQHFHSFLQQQIDQAVQRDLPLILILGDLDHFKKINDGYGHLAGDEVIKLVSRCLKNNLRASDLVARYGGEEFAFLCPQTDVEEGRQIAESLRRSVATQRIVYDGKPIQVTMSFGVAVFAPATPITKNELITQADKALYQAKDKGRNRCVVFA